MALPPFPLFGSAKEEAALFLARAGLITPPLILSGWRSRIGGQRLSGVLQTELVADRVTQFLLAAEITLRRLNRCVPRRNWILLQLSGAQMTAAGATAPQIMRAVHPPENSARGDLGGRSPASTARFTQIGTGTVRICFPLPIRPAMTQCSSRI